MKKMLKTLMLTLIITTSAIPAKSSAGVGLLTGNVPLAIVGGGLTGISSAATFMDLDGFDESPVWFLSSLLGLLILDGEHGAELEFSNINSNDITGTGHTSEDIEIYNSELDQINLIFEQVEHDLSRIDDPTMEDSRLAWESYRMSVSPESYSVMQSIMASILK